MTGSQPADCRESFGERIANTVTHGIGAVLSVAGLAVLVVLASLHGTVLHIVSLTIYGTTLVLLYLASTVYHAVRGPRARQICRILDHAAIFLLIAGTYTPFALIGLGGYWGWTIFAVIWALAVAGVLMKVFRCVERERTSIIFYLAMGWLVLAAFGELLATMEPGGLVWLVLGGVAYTSGVAFYVWDRLPFNHAVWHLFVLLGSACHFAAILFYIAPWGV